MNLYLHALKKYAVFNGRATRAELWTFLIVNVIIKIILAVISVKMGLYITDNPEEDRTLLDGLFAIAVFLPTVAVSVRRIHDVGLSGWWGWLFLPLMIPMIIVSFMNSKADNKYETNSKYSTNESSKLWNFVGLSVMFLLVIIAIVKVQNDRGESSKPSRYNTPEENRIACDGGDMQACNSLGLMYVDGKGVKQNFFKSTELYRKACNGGYAEGCHNLGFAYERGQAVGQDYFKAIELYRKICDDGGCTKACGSLASMYEDGLGVEEDNLMMIKLYTKACNGDDGTSCSILGFNYLSGDKIRQNKVKAKEFFGKGCDNGDTTGCEYYAKLNEEGY